MADISTIRLNLALRELNISLDRAVEFLSQKDIEIEARPTAKISKDIYRVLLDEFATDKSKKDASHEISEEKKKEKESLRVLQEKKEQDRIELQQKRQEVIRAKAEVTKPVMLGKIDLNPSKAIVKPPVVKKSAAPKAPGVVTEKPVEKIEIGVLVEEKATKKTEEVTALATVKEAAEAVGETPVKAEVTKSKAVSKDSDVTDSVAPEVKAETTAESTPSKVDSKSIKTKYKTLTGFKKTGQTIDLDEFKKKEKTVEDARKRKRKRISKDPAPKPEVRTANTQNRTNTNSRQSPPQKGRTPQPVKAEPTDEEVQKQIRETLEKLQGKSNKSKGAKYRRDKRDQHRQKSEEELAEQEAGSKTIKVTEFITVGEIATLMEISSTEIISACMSLGIMVTMNQRLDAETLSIVADEFGYQVEFVKTELEENIDEEEDVEEDLK